MKLFKKGILFLLVAFLFFVAYLFFNMFTFPSKQISRKPIEPLQISSTSVSNFSKAIQIQTVSPEDPKDFDTLQFQQFADFLSSTYPLADSLLDKKNFNDFSFLYHWEGSKPDLKPIILMGHLDVVPVIEENIPDWKESPFGGEIIQDTIWGRGTIDDKVGVIGILEATERLLQNGYQPERSIYLAFGHDEEIGGVKGAQAIAAYLKEQNVQAEFVLDEGGSIVQNMVPGIPGDVALIGIAEKGFVSLSLSVKVEGGHSSMPERETAIDILSSAIAKLKQKPFPSLISAPIDGFIQYLGPEMPFVNKLVFANKPIFSSVITKIYEGSASGNALVRTTTSPTIFNSGVKENIIPQSAKATINFRIIPGETIESVEERVKKTINDERIHIQRSAFISNPSKVSKTDSFGFQTIQETITETFPSTLVSPYLVVGGTDSRHFNEISDDIYRFSAIKLNKGNIKSFHGLNERIPVSDFENSIRFYHQLILNATEN
ncbi:M20/M25/M40 family metallo-hydrolase [Echinicola sp. CAU 1574]|uniref:M20/M25/M40 family metallo-hydrolase n=1 Tax=Echinicola arenosa TaxID=2774144 RepID=A0ABR9AQ17_9BACT|nr:M20 family peptidase [Echinicola arenosa]MBD8489694.1 M20/M25/M40 family metallo-hydrolase [Echinicola arenosa]